MKLSQHFLILVALLGACALRGDLVTLYNCSNELVWAGLFYTRVQNGIPEVPKEYVADMQWVKLPAWTYYKFTRPGRKIGLDRDIVFMQVTPATNAAAIKTIQQAPLSTGAFSLQKLKLYNVGSFRSEVYITLKGFATHVAFDGVPAGAPRFHPQEGPLLGTSQLLEQSSKRK